MTQKENALSDPTEEGEKEKIFQLHITTGPLFCQILRGAAAGAAFLGMLGVVGGMEHGRVGLLPGTFWAAVCLVLWIMSLEQGGWLN